VYKKKRIAMSRIKTCSSTVLRSTKIMRGPRMKRVTVKVATLDIYLHSISEGFLS
jgi:hypothetical protein